MYDLLKDAVSSSDGGPIAMNGWMIVNNEQVDVKRVAVA
jgi:hypothetical protein